MVKRFTNGRRYNTESARKICEWETESTKEALYRKQTGEYFLCGSGDAQSRYAYIEKGVLIGGENIVPITLTEAESLTKEHADAGVYQKLFGKKEIGEKKQVNLTMDTGTANLLKLLQVRTGKPAVGLICDLIKEKAEEEGLL